ncbi:hypothetical protein SBF1_3740003 [Candidatus Desulfosporosinus infrequens]|uniref:Uncharacterized protein n=1 Tax=Candidatus Desulfosporosinus infrequens TaxID=2043169 RepID=A0A2U3L4X0_9FIRM|nr:hypothetical protein SBF1_3740003 [Candidatus Desulfosporosinus infrequens]
MIRDMYMAGKSNKIGMRVTENGNTVGEYTFHLSGLQIVMWGAGCYHQSCIIQILYRTTPFSAIGKCPS